VDLRLRIKLRRTAARKGRPEERVKKCLTAETADNAWFDELTMSAHPKWSVGSEGLHGFFNASFGRTPAVTS